MTRSRPRGARGRAVSRGASSGRGVSKRRGGATPARVSAPSCGRGRAARRAHAINKTGTRGTTARRARADAADAESSGNESSSEDRSSSAEIGAGNDNESDSGSDSENDSGSDSDSDSEDDWSDEVSLPDTATDTSEGPLSDREPTEFELRVLWQRHRLKKDFSRACRFGDLEAVSELIKYVKAGRLKAAVAKGITLACEHGHLEVLKLLIPKYSDGNVNCNRHTVFVSPLHLAVQNGHLEVAKFFLDRADKYPTLDVNCRDGEGNTPLHTLFSSDSAFGEAIRSKAQFEKFLSAFMACEKVDFRARNVDGQTPLMLAIESTRNHHWNSKDPFCQRQRLWNRKFGGLQCGSSDDGDENDGDGFDVIGYLLDHHERVDIDESMEHLEYLEQNRFNVLGPEQLERIRAMKDCLTKALAAREKRLLKDRKTLLLVNASEITFDRTKPPFAEGNFGEVYVGKLFGTTDVAIKVVRPRRTIDVDPAELLEMVQHEANVWERVGNHPNVLPLMAFCLEPQPMLISNLIKNGNLRSYLERHGWDLSKGLKLLQDVAKGMSALQKQGVVHSDLKPANILVDHGGAALVADFGLSRITATAGGDEVRGGTPGYIAPELYVAGTAPHGASDVFAFAMVAFEVASRGAKPLPHGTWSNSDIAAFLTGGGRPTRPYGIGDDIWALIQRCWAQDPLERPSFEDIVQELDRIRGPAANDDADDGAAGTPIDAGSRPTSSYSRTKSIRVSGRGSK